MQAQIDASDPAVRPSGPERIDFNKLLNENPKTGGMYTVDDLFADLIALVRAEMQLQVERSSDRDLDGEERFASIGESLHCGDVLKSLVRAQKAWRNLSYLDLSEISLAEVLTGS